MDSTKDQKVDPMEQTDVEDGRIPWEAPDPKTTAGRRRWHLPKVALASKLLDRLCGLPKRRYLLVIGGIVFLIILAIGLGAGLGSKHKSKQNLPLPGNAKQYTGDLTYYAPGLGACGVTSKDSERIVAISHTVYDAVTPGSDPNANPLCGKKIRAKHTSATTGEMRSVDLTVVDRCVGCKPEDLDITQPTFNYLAPDGDGRTTVTWAWLE